MAGQVVNQPHLPRLAETRGAVHQENTKPHTESVGCPFAIRCYAPAGKQSCLDLRGDGVYWGRPAYSPGRQMAADICRSLSNACSKEFQMFGPLHRCAAGFGPVEGRGARFNQPTTQPTSLPASRALAKPERRAYCVYDFPREAGGGGRIGDISCDVQHHVSDRSKDGSTDVSCDWTPGLQSRIWRTHSGRDIVASKDLAQNPP